MKRKILATALSFALIASATLSFGSEVSYAADENWSVSAEEAAGGTTRDTQVLYTQASTYIVTIPKSINIDSTTKTAEYSINVNGDVSANQTVNVAPVDNVAEVDGINIYMQEQSQAATRKDDVVATIVQESTSWTAEEIGQVDADGVTVIGTDKTGTISAEGLSSGTWSSVLTFNISLETAP